MGQVYSIDLRERVIADVKEGLSRREAARKRRVIAASKPASRQGRAAASLARRLRLAGYANMLVLMHFSNAF